MWMAVAKVQTCLLSRKPTVLQAPPETSPMSCEGGGAVSGEVKRRYVRTYVHTYIHIHRGRGCTVRVPPNHAGGDGGLGVVVVVVVGGCDHRW